MEAAAPISKNYGRNLKKSINRTFSSTPCENLAPINYQNGILQTPPILYHSFPPFLAHKKQPPLLPLPISKTSVHQHYNHINTLSQNKAFSLPPINRRVNNNVKPTRKSKSSTSSPKKDQESPKSSKVVMVSSTNPLGPDPKDLPKDVSMVLSMSSTGEKEQSGHSLSSQYARSPKKDDAKRNQLSLLHMTGEKEQPIGALNSQYARRPKKDDANKNQLSLLHMTSKKERSISALNSRNARNPEKDVVNRKQLSQLHTNIVKESIETFVAFTTISPPPSSLPLPTFSLRPKLSCNAEASAGVDAGATDNLRRLLRLG
ncbi:uncharacterized protein LOC132628134 [Lycium barbarum]|uniref:uncharacterized protein LOC132628134 n=1 Tax=Lycium barbarum TaxID=112863 RepID=UPI00293E602D|nr:uncharacterized protein LOC132628134 [Lycium barbarum]